MKRNIKFMVAASLAVGGCSYLAPSALAEDNVTVKTKTETVRTSDRDQLGHDLSFPAGIQVKDLKEKDDIRNAFKGVTESALTKGDFKLVVNRLVDADRDRIGKFKDADNYQKLDGRIDQFRKDWKAKYGQDFKIDENKVFADQFVRILQGEVSDPKALVGNWPVQATDRMIDRAVTAGSKVDIAKQAKDANKPFGGETNLEKGRNVALAYLPASHGAPALKLSLIHELPDVWRFDIPDNIDGQKLHDGLLNHLTWLDEHKDRWPGDVNEAYRMVGHHVLMAVYDVPMSEHGGDLAK